MSVNWAKLAPDVKTTPLCRRQSIPIRGRRADWSHYVSVECENFPAKLNLRVDSGDEVLKIVLKQLPKILHADQKQRRMKCYHVVLK